MKSIGRLIVFLAFATSCAGGGGNGGTSGNGGASNGDAPGGDHFSYGPCEPHASTGTLTEVDLDVDSPLPPELEVANCALGDPTKLRGVLALGLHSCILTVDATSAKACCPEIPVGSYDAFLTYRPSASAHSLGTQGPKFITLSKNGDPVVTLTLAGEPLEDTGSTATNRADWCAGLL